MRKLVLVIITLNILTNTCCTSLPISTKLYSDTLQTEEIKKYHYSLLNMGVDLSSCKSISCRSGIKPIATKFKSLTITLKKIPLKKEKKLVLNIFFFQFYLHFFLVYYR